MTGVCGAKFRYGRLASACVRLEQAMPLRPVMLQAAVLLVHGMLLEDDIVVWEQLIALKRMFAILICVCNVL